MRNLFTFLLNTLFIGIPEEFIWVCFSLTLLERFDLIDWRRWKRNIKLLSIPVIPVSITINFLRYIVVVKQPIMNVCTLLMFIFLLYYIVDKTDRLNNTKFCKIIFVSLLGSCFIALTETIYTPIILYLTNTKISDVNNNFINNLCLSSPSRLIQISILAFMISNKIYKSKFSCLKQILKNKLNVILLFILAIIMVVFWIFSINVFSNEGIFSNLTSSTKILLGCSMNLLPTLFFVIMIINSLYYIRKNIQIEEKYSHMLDDIE